MPMRQAVGVVFAILGLALLHALVVIAIRISLCLANRLIVVSALDRRVILGVVISLLA